MNAPQLDDWGRDLAFRAAATDKPLPIAPPPALDPAMREEMVALRTRLAELEARVMASGDPDMLPGSDWVRRLAMAVADHWEVSVFELIGRTRVDVVIRPRFALCWLLQQVAGYTNPRIATLVGYTDHTSAIHAVRRAQDWRETDEAFRWATDRLLLVARQLRGESLRSQAALPARDGQ